MTIACSKFKLHHFCCGQPKWSFLPVCTIAGVFSEVYSLSLLQVLLVSASSCLRCTPRRMSIAVSTPSSRSANERASFHSLHNQEKQSPFIKLFFTSSLSLCRPVRSRLFFSLGLLAGFSHCWFLEFFSVYLFIFHSCCLNF